MQVDPKVSGLLPKESCQVTDRLFIDLLGRVFIITNVRPGDMDDEKVEFGWTMGSQPGM